MTDRKKLTPIEAAYELTTTAALIERMESITQELIRMYPAFMLTEDSSVEATRFREVIATLDSILQSESTFLFGALEDLGIKKEEFFTFVKEKRIKAIQESVNKLIDKNTKKKKPSEFN